MKYILPALGALLISGCTISQIIPQAMTEVARSTDSDQVELVISAGHSAFSVTVKNLTDTPLYIDKEMEDGFTFVFFAREGAQIYMPTGSEEISELDRNRYRVIPPHKSYTKLFRSDDWYADFFLITAYGYMDSVTSAWFYNRQYCKVPHIEDITQMKVSYSSYLSFSPLKNTIKAGTSVRWIRIHDGRNYEGPFAPPKKPLYYKKDSSIQKQCDQS